MVEAVYFAVAFIGLLHGLEPGHGWPAAMLYAKQSSKPLLKGLISSSVISLFHLVSSMAVVAAYVIMKLLVNFSISHINYLAGGALLVLGLRFLLRKPRNDIIEQHGHIHDNFRGGEHGHEHEHSGFGRHTHRHRHAKRVFLTLWSIAVFAFILGFAHEEEFALLALVVAGVDPLTLMITYAYGVTLGLAGITLIAIKIYGKFESRLKQHQNLIPKLSGIALIIMALNLLLSLR